ncbi:hypothetical protein B0H13DRAFT_1032078 [Mycena leptocephala]|nr:hypothetical protein B0H13DRAFT_1032078 [Mycena leptocephala]
MVSYWASNTTHKVVLTMANPGAFIVADGFIYTVNNGSSPSSSSSFSSKKASQTASATAGAASAAPPSSQASPTPQPLPSGAPSAPQSSSLLSSPQSSSTTATPAPAREQRPGRMGRGRRLPTTTRTVPRRCPPAPDAPAEHVRRVDGPLLASPWDRSASTYHDDPRTYSRSASSTATARPRRGARCRRRRASDPSSYDDESELASGSGSIARTASSARLFGVAGSSARREKAVPLREEVYTPAPPAYTE